MGSYQISGIQQIGIGNGDIPTIWKFYRQFFGMDVPVFSDTAQASLMSKYTGNTAHYRHAVLALNIQGGGGFELWQYAKKQPLKASFDICLADFGIHIVKIKTINIENTYRYFKANNLDIKSEIVIAKNGKKHFYIADPNQNLFEITESNNWFCNQKKHTGGVAGVVIGVSDMEKSISFYTKILGYDEVVFDETAIFDDYKNLPGGKNLMRRVLLKHKDPRKGAFSNLFGHTEIELLSTINNTGRKVFENRHWGDNGFIHICFDVSGMHYLKDACKQAGYSFTVDSSNSFNMGHAAGHFAYIEDPDGTLIEFVETHKVPVFKKLGIYFNLKNRNPQKPLANWMIKLLAIGRIKD